MRFRRFFGSAPSTAAGQERSCHRQPRNPESPHYSKINVHVVSSVKRTRVPGDPGSSQMRPPWASTIAFEIASPRPAPSAPREGVATVEGLEEAIAIGGGLGDQVFGGQVG